MIARPARRRSQRSDAGASAVEFALLAPVLFLVLFGIIDYGIWFSDSISARQAVRDGARRGVVENFGSCSPAATGTSADLHSLACTINAAMEPISGTTYVRVSIAKSPADPSQNPPTVKWSDPQSTLRVCAMTKHTNLLPLVPFPSDGISRTRVDMPIEQAIGANAATRTSYADNPPAGSDWSWCP
jgi:Flp pilus assembly protein TadG